MVNRTQSLNRNDLLLMRIFQSDSVLLVIRWMLKLVLILFNSSGWLAYSSFMILTFPSTTIFWGRPLTMLDEMIDPTYRRLAVIYSVSEFIFYLIFIYRRHSLLRSDLKIHQHHHLTCNPHSPSPELRQSILDSILTSFRSPQELRQLFVAWFYELDHPSNPWDGRSGQVDLESIYADNASELIAFMFFSSTLESLDQHQRSMVNADLSKIQSAIHHTFPLGRNHKIHAIRPFLEPIKSEHRPLIFYLIIESVQFVVHAIYRLVGFRQAVLPINGTHFTYWFHPGYCSPSSSRKTVDNNQVPIILVAGIVGLISVPHYALSLLWTSNRPIFLIGNSSVSLRLAKPEFQLIQVNQSSLRRKILTYEEHSTCIKKMMEIHGFKARVEKDPIHQTQTGGAFLIGHSLGTSVTSHFIRHHEDCVAGTLSIDPISVLPYVPNLVRKFVYAEPETVGELLIRIVAREIGVATVIQRHFHWFEFVAFPHLENQSSSLQVQKITNQGLTEAQLNLSPSKKAKHHYILSDQDALVSYETVSKYLENSSNCHLTTLVSTPHAGFLLFHLPQVVELTLELINQSEPPNLEDLSKTKCTSRHKKHTFTPHRLDQASYDISKTDLVNPSLIHVQLASPVEKHQLDLIHSFSF